MPSQEGFGLTIFDIDDTLLHTFNVVKVMKGRMQVRILDASQFNTDVLAAGESYDFSDFSDSKRFSESARPLNKMMAKAKAILSNVKKKTGSRVIILTARADFDDRDVFLDTFRKFGFDIDSVYVERGGNLGLGTVRGKEVIISRYLDTGNYARVRLFDDAIDNIRMFLKLQTKYPDISFEAYWVDSTGNARRQR